MSANIAAEKLKENYPDHIIDVIEFRDETTVVVNADQIIDICKYLRDDPELKFNYLVDLSGVDMGVDSDPRFYVVYHMLSHEHKNRVRIKAPVYGEEPEIDSVTSVWSTADWHERECYDLLGVKFRGHPDLRRILLPYHWDSHPLRKDYPLKGKGEEFLVDEDDSEAIR